MSRAWLTGATALVALGLGPALVGCGDEKTFTARTFVDRANAQGAGVELGEELTSTSGGPEIWALRFAGAGGAMPPASPGGPKGEVPVPDLAHGAASLAVADGVDQAEEELGRCESAATLTCFRAANVVVRVENATNQEIARLTEALRAMET